MKSARTSFHPQVALWRAIVTFVVVVGAFAAFIWRLTDLQLSPDEALLNNAGSKIIEETIEASRGAIVDRHGRPLALSVPRFNVIADGRAITSSGDTINRDYMVDALAALLPKDREQIAAALSIDKRYVRLARQVEPSVSEKVQQLNFTHIYLEDDLFRTHPNGSCSALEILGGVDTDHNGKSGLEKKYDGFLQGKDGVALRQFQPKGAVQIPDGFRVVEAHTPGAELKLSIDRNIQYEAEQILIRTLQEAHGSSAIAVISNPTNGEIYAMASAELNPENGELGCTSYNRAAVWTYEPGSAMKTVTLAGVFEHGAWSVEDVVAVPATINIAREAGVEDHVYQDPSIAWGQTHQVLPAEILARSSNTGTIVLAQELGADRLQATFERFGFGTRTDLAFPGESSGILGDLDSHSLMLSNTAIGQSVAVTPVQLLQAYNTLAKKGISAGLTLLSNSDSVLSAGADERVVSQSTAATMMSMMRGVVSSGTGKRAQIDGYLVSGKTGTAWQPCGDVAGYVCGEVGGEKVRHYTATFVGIVENEQGPVLSAIVVVDNPKGKNYGGGSVAAPVFAELMEYSLRQLHLAPFGDGSMFAQRVRALPVNEVAMP